MCTEIKGCECSKVVQKFLQVWITLKPKELAESCRWLTSVTSVSILFLLDKYITLKNSKPGENIWLNLLWIVIFIWKKAFCKEQVGLPCFVLVFHLKVLHMHWFWWTVEWLMFLELIWKFWQWRPTSVFLGGKWKNCNTYTYYQQHKYETNHSWIFKLGWS